MKKVYNISGFTFIELIISISILAILSILGFISYSKNLEDSRDSERMSDLKYIANALKVNKTNRGNYPSPLASFNIVNSGALAAIQGSLSSNIVLSTLDKVPLDPYTKTPYVYSIWRNNAEFQMATTLENNGRNKSMITGDYKVMSKNYLPTIVLAISGIPNVEINEFVGSGAENRKKFIFDNSIHNLPYTFALPYLPYSDNTPFTGLIDDPNINWKQNNDYKNCNDIFNQGKNIGTGEYQINNYGTLENIICSANYIPKNCKEIKKLTPSSIDGNYTIMPEGVNRSFNAYCDMTTASGGWTLVAKDGDSFNYTIGHCNFMDPPTNISKAGSNFIYWACDLDQREMLFWTPTGWVIGTNKVKEDCSLKATRDNNNTCSWTGASQTFQLESLSGGCMSGNTNPPTSWNLWWKGGDWVTGVTKNLSGLSTILNGSCNNVSIENTSYCSLFDIYDDVSGKGIGQGWGYRLPSCGGYLEDGVTLSPESHLIYVR